MAEKKSQHFVPQMYFRNFSENGRSIGGYVLSSRKFVSNMAISGICQRDYLYGNDLQIENWFSELEKKWAPLLRKIIRQGNLDITNSEWTLLLEFLYLCDARTGFTADISDDFTTKIFQVYALAKRDHGDTDFSEYTDEQIHNMRIGMNIPNAAPLRMMDKALWLFADLVPALIYNTTSRPFITSDNPVVKYNYLFTTRKYHCNYGYGHLGILFFLPISPKYCLMIYDPNTYKILSFDNVITINASDQIIELNKLFAMNAKSAVYFQNSAREWVIDGYTYGIQDTSQVFNNHVLQNENGDYIVQFSSYSNFKYYKLSFLEINSHVLEMQFPKHLGGPLRPEVQKLNAIENKKTLPTHLSGSRFHYLPEFD